MGVRVKSWKGAWWVFIDHHRQRRAKRVGVGRRGKKLAEDLAVKIQARLLEGDVSDLRRAAGPPTIPTVAEYAESWLTTLARPRPATVEQYRLRFRVHLLPLIGDLPLTAVTRERVRTLLGELVLAGNRRAGKDAGGRRRPLARGTVKGLLHILSGLLERAVEEGWLAKNPAQRLTREIPASTTAVSEVEEIEVFTPDELTRLLRTAESDYPEWYPFLLCLARSGVRLGEAVALEWRDVDFEHRLLLIRRTERRGRVSVPKSGKARRVDMSRQLARVLADRKSLLEAEAALAGQPVPTRVFLHPEGHPVRDDAWRNNVWTPMLRRAGLRYRKPHTLRHSYASLLIEAGESLKYVQEQLGHHSPAFTLAVYGHLLPRGDRRAVDRLDDATARNPRATTSTGSEPFGSETAEIHGEVSLPAH